MDHHDEPQFKKQWVRQLGMKMFSQNKNRAHIELNIASCPSVCDSGTYCAVSDVKLLCLCHVDTDLTRIIHLCVVCQYKHHIVADGWWTSKYSGGSGGGLLEVLSRNFPWRLKLSLCLTKRCAMNAYWESGYIDPHLLDLVTSCGDEWSASRPGLFSPEEQPRHPLDRRLGRPQSRSARQCEGKILYLTKTRTSAPRSPSP
jgi:hypothetical protein